MTTDVKHSALPVTGGFHSQGTSDAVLWLFLWCLTEKKVEQTVKKHVNSDASTLIWRNCNSFTRFIVIYMYVNLLLIFIGVHACYFLKSIRKRKCHFDIFLSIGWSGSWYHDDDIKWKHFPPYWPFVRGIHRSPVNSPHKGHWREALMFSLICAWINGWVNNHENDDLRRHRAHYDVTVLLYR